MQNNEDDDDLFYGTNFNITEIIMIDSGSYFGFIFLFSFCDSVP